MTRKVCLDIMYTHNTKDNVLCDMPYKDLRGAVTRRLMVMLKFRNLILIFCVVAIILMLYSCHKENVKYEENPFPEYQVLDPNLRCMSLAKSLGFWWSEDYFSHRYYQIDGSDASEFLGLYLERLTIPGSQGQYYILQPTDDPIDVLTEWTFDAAEFIFVAHGEEYPSYSRNNDASITVYRTEDRTVYTELLAMKASPNKYEYFDANEYDAEYLEAFQVPDADQSLFDVLLSYRLFIRIIFEESTVIVWETDISLAYPSPPYTPSFTAPSTYYLEIGLASTITDDWAERQRCLIERNSSIYQAVIAALEAYAVQ